jgi:XTP/dITP diphosphohydrolase
MKALVLASNNPGKLREFNTMLAGMDIEAVPQARFGVSEVAETGLSFVENAIIKARHAAALSGMAALADDSGLEVDALNGAPGIYSARFAGTGASDSENLDKLLTVMRDVPLHERGARFQCVIVTLRHAQDPMPVIAQGTWEGRILTAPAGANGFGYDPVFFVPTHGCSAAELDPAVKNTLSHRGQALRALQRAMSAQAVPASP